MSWRLNSKKKKKKSEDRVREQKKIEFKKKTFRTVENSETKDLSRREHKIKVLLVKLSPLADKL